MGVTDEQSVRTADAQQAAYLRDALLAERQLLVSEIGKRRALIDRPGEAGRRVRRAVRSVEAQVRYVERLIAGIDSRFGTREQMPVSR